MDRSRASRRNLNRIGLVLATLAAALLSFTAWARAQNTMSSEELARLRQHKETERRLMMQGAQSRIESARAARAWQRWKAAHPNARRGERVRKAPEGEERALPRDLAPAGPMPAAGAAPLRIQAVPTNVRCNNPAGDPTGTGQSEESVARFGNNVLVAWNDGQGFNTGGDIQNYAYSTDGGVTFIQPGGGIPHPAGAVGFRWYSDPSVTVNEATGEFYVAALCDSGPIVSGIVSYNGLAVAKCHFPGGSAPPVWSATHTVRTVSSFAKAIDKEWVAVDPLSGRVFVSYTLFTAGNDSIEFQRSQDGGATWGPVQILSSSASAGFVQGSRVIAGPNGEVYQTWFEIGQTTWYDFMRIRKSVNGGASFGGEATVCQLFSNYGTGAPGFNRLTGITFPSIAVDRTAGPHRGRLYVAWNESVDWSNDPMGFGGIKNEVEPNASPGAATLFTPGQQLHGSLATTSDLDFYSFAATQGTNYMFLADTVAAGLQYTMRVYCSDGATRLAAAGTDANTGGNWAFIDWTCPANGTYYLRMASNGSAGSYVVDTGVNGANTGERSRDHRDIFVAHSDDGTTWAPATRANDDPPWFDNWLPEVAVGADGMVYAAWYDWRDDPNCGGSSNVYVARSSDGGGTWQPSVPVTSAATAWTSVNSNIMPNQGDYIALRSDGRIMQPSWADGRSGDPDVWATNFDTGFDFTSCPTVTAVATGATLPLTFAWTNANSVFGNSYTYRLTDTAGWITDGPIALNVAAAASASVPYSIVVPDTTYNVNDLTFQVSNETGAIVQNCVVHLTVTGHVAPPPPTYAFALASPVPNPMTTASRIAFTLPKAGQVKLVIYGLNGERVRTLLDGQTAAGPGSITWDGLNDNGQRARAGVYFYRLETPGYTANRRLVFTP